jgi:hypothetical protein
MMPIPSKRETSPPQEDRPEWLKNMREHYTANGFYRAEDVHRVLDDPRNGIGISVSSDRAAARLHKK